MFPNEWHEEKIDRHLMASQVRPYGISFLDDALVGIFPNDLIVVGAKTGRGKTELMTILALNQSMLGRNVAFFALEADRLEIQRRIKYKAMAKVWYENYSTSPVKFPRFVEWMSGGFEKEWDQIETIIDKDIQMQTNNLRIIYTDAKYSLKNFLDNFNGLSQEVDLFIIDHLHYFDVGSKTESEGIKEIIHAIRGCSIKLGKPVILISHLRKTERKLGGLMPDLEDFHGHSDISKVCTTAILIAPADIPMIKTHNCFQTYFHIAKSRKASENIPYVGILGYDKSIGTYRDKYYIAKNKLFDAPELITNSVEIPKWFKNAFRDFNSLGAPVLKERDYHGNEK